MFKAASPLSGSTDRTLADRVEYLEAQLAGVVSGSTGGSSTGTGSISAPPRQPQTHATSDSHEALTPVSPQSGSVPTGDPSTAEGVATSVSPQPGSVPSERAGSVSEQDRSTTTATDTSSAPETVPAEAASTPETAVVASPEPVTAVKQRSNPTGEFDLNSFTEIWPTVREKIQQSSPLLAALLDDCRPESLLDSTIALSWPESAAFLQRKAEDPTNSQLIAEAIQAVTGERLRIKYELHAHTKTDEPAALSEEELIARITTEFDAQELPAEPIKTGV